MGEASQNQLPMFMYALAGDICSTGVFDLLLLSEDTGVMYLDLLIDSAAQLSATRLLVCSPRIEFLFRLLTGRDRIPGFMHLPCLNTHIQQLPHHTRYEASFVSLRNARQATNKCGFPSVINLPHATRSLFPGSGSAPPGQHQRPYRGHGFAAV